MKLKFEATIGPYRTFTFKRRTKIRLETTECMIFAFIIFVYSCYCLRPFNICYIFEGSIDQHKKIIINSYLTSAVKLSHRCTEKWSFLNNSSKCFASRSEASLPTIFSLKSTLLMMKTFPRHFPCISYTYCKFRKTIIYQPVTVINKNTCLKFNWMY